MENVRSLSDVDGLGRRPEQQRLVYWYDVPDEMAASTGIKRVGLVELTAGEELMAGKRITGGPMDLAWELAKESFRYADGLKLTTADNSLEAVWNSSTPMMAQLRALVVTAYSEIHQPRNVDTAAFLKSRRVEAR